MARVGDACARELIRRHLSPDVCKYCVSRNASIGVTRRGLLVVCRDLPITFFLSNFWGLSTLKKLNTETCVCCTKFGIVTFIMNGYT